MKILSAFISILILIGCTKEKTEENLIEIEQVLRKKTIDIIPDKIFSFPETNYQLDINEDGIFDIVFTSSGSSSNNFTSESILVQSIDNKIAANDQPPPFYDFTICSDNMIIPDSAIWSNSICTMYSYSYQALPPPGVTSEGGPWLGKYDKFLTLQYMVNGEPLYAWIKISHGGGAKLIIKEFTYEYKL